VRRILAILVLAPFSVLAPSVPVCQPYPTATPAPVAVVAPPSPQQGGDWPRAAPSPLFAELARLARLGLMR
jgi:alpha/beta superfamily hydrolase